MGFQRVAKTAGKVANDVANRCGRTLPWTAGWALAAAVTLVFSLVTDLATHRAWGLGATLGYTCAALVARLLPPRGAGAASAWVALAGAVVLPLLCLALTGGRQSEVGVIERSATLLLHHGTPYLPHPRDVDDYTPYLPAMALFGMPRALLGEHHAALRLLGDARIWCAAAYLACLAAARRVVRGPAGRAPDGTRGAQGRASRRVGEWWAPRAAAPWRGCLPEGRADRAEPDGRARYWTAMAALTASPPLALAVCVSGVDLPLAGLCCLALACAARQRPGAAGLALAAACSLKWTAWPALAVAVALLGRTGASGSGAAGAAAGGAAARLMAARGVGVRGTVARGVGAWGMAARWAVPRGPGVRCALTAVAGTLALSLPSALLSPFAMLQQVLAFPTGRAEVATPAAGPLPGCLLAGLGPVGWYAAAGLLALGALAVGTSLVTRPPDGLTAAAGRLATGLCVGFLLAPAGRFGYLTLPLVVVVWAHGAVSGRRSRAASRPRSGTPRRRTPGVPRAAARRRHRPADATARHRVRRHVVTGPPHRPGPPVPPPAVPSTAQPPGPFTTPPTNPFTAPFTVPRSPEGARGRRALCGCPRCGPGPAS